MQQLDSVRITEIFFSLQGETRTVGLPTVFVRLTGCPLRCRYCDTAYAFHGGNKLTIDDILTEVGKYSAQYVTVTGGEPLAQKSCFPFCSVYVMQAMKFHLETSGALDVAEVDPRVVKVVDVKTPGSAEVDKNLLGQSFRISYPMIRSNLSFVIEADYEWSKDVLRQYDLANAVRCYFRRVISKSNRVI